jgi:hypothetical protein
MGGSGAGGAGVGGAGGAGTGGRGVGGAGAGGSGAGGAGTGGSGAGGAGTGGSGAGGATVVGADAAADTPTTRPDAAKDAERDTAPPPCLPQELLADPGFDIVGATAWTSAGSTIIYTADGSPLASTPEIAAQSPPRLAWLGGLNRADDTIAQNLTIPARATSLTLSFYYAIFTAESPGGKEYDNLDVQLVLSDQTLTLAHLSDNDATDSWTPLTVTLPDGLGGRLATLQFHATTDASYVTSFYIDTTSLQAMVCP